MNYCYKLSDDELREMQNDYAKYVSEDINLLNNLFCSIADVIQKTKFKPFKDIAENIYNLYQNNCKDIISNNIDNYFVNKALSNVCRYIHAGSEAEEKAYRFECGIKDIFTENYIISAGDISSYDISTPNVRESDFDDLAEMFKKLSYELESNFEVHLKKFSSEEQNKFRVCLKLPIVYQSNILKNITNTIADTFLKLKDRYVDIIKASNDAEDLFDGELRNDMVSGKVIEDYAEFMINAETKHNKASSDSGSSNMSVTANPAVLNANDEESSPSEIPDDVKKYIDEKHNEILKILTENNELLKKLSKYSESTNTLMPQKISKSDPKKIQNKSKQSREKTLENEMIPIYNKELYDNDNVINICRMILQIKRSVYRELETSTEKATLRNGMAGNVMSVVTSLLGDEYVKLITSFLPSANIKLASYVANAANKLLSSGSIKNASDEMLYKKTIDNFITAYSNQYVGLVGRIVMEVFYIKQTKDRNNISNAFCPSLLRYMDSVEEKEFDYIETAYMVSLAAVNRFIEFKQLDMNAANAIHIKFFKISYKILKKCSEYDADKATDR